MKRRRISKLPRSKNKLLLTQSKRQATIIKAAGLSE